MMLRLIAFLGLIASLSASGQDALNASVLFQWKEDTIPGSAVYDNAYNEIWGFTQDGNEYAVIGSTLGTHIFDVTDPASAEEVAFVEGAVASPVIIHRDFHDYAGYLYVVADEGFSSLQIIDLSGLPASVEVVYDSSALFQRSHNIFIDEDAGMMYVCGGNTTLNVYSLADPEAPTLVIDCDQSVDGWGAIGYVHDVYVRDGIAWCNAADALFVVDFSNPSEPQVLGSLTEYPENGYNHSGWLNEDGTIYALADENHGLRIKLVDVSDLTDMQVVGFAGSGVNELSIVHNLIWDGDFLHVSHYYDGYYVFDCSDPTNPELAAFYDTSTIAHQSSYEGAWGVYPLLPSGNVLVSDMQEGLFIIAPSLPTAVSETDNEEFQVFPNPARPGGWIQADVPGEKADRVWLTASDGTIVCDYGSITFPLQLPTDLAAGLYHVNIQKQKQTLTTPIICQP